MMQKRYEDINMNKSFKKSIALLLAVIMLMTTMIVSPFSSEASISTAPQLEGSLLSIWADPQNKLTQADINDAVGGSKLSVLGSVQPSKVSTSESKYYWFFPSTADLSALKIWYAEGSTLEITSPRGTTQVTSGVPTNLFENINGGGVSVEYTVKLDNTSYSVTAIKSGDVGTVYIDTSSGSLSAINGDADHEASESGTIMVVQPDGSVDYQGVMEKMSGRGNGTWNTSGTKLPYNIKLGVSKSLLGMPSAKKWCLLANAGDSTLITNQLTYDFADYIGIKYQPHCKPVDLYVNQQYLGSYQLAEKVELKSNRINVTDAYENLEIANGTVSESGAILPKDLTGTEVGSYTASGNTSISGGSTKTFGSTVGNRKYSSLLISPTDYTGGYLYELEINDRWPDENAGFSAYNRQGWVLKSCDYASKEMVNYSYDLLFALGSSVYNGGTVPSKSVTTTCSTNLVGGRTTVNPAPAVQYQGKRWSDILDAESAIKYYWVQEFFKNMDSSTSSTYFYKDTDSINSKLYAGPVWDMDNALGESSEAMRWGADLKSSSGWYAKMARIYKFIASDSSKDYDTDRKAPLNFYAALATNCTDFWEMAEKNYYRDIAPAVDVLLGSKVDPDGTLKSIEYYVNTVAKSAAMNNIRHEKNFNAATIISSKETWVSERNTWIDSQIAKTDLSGATVSNVGPFAYTGNEIRPEPTVTLFVSGTGTVTLEKDVDYALSYENNINAGTAKVTVTGIGTYSGSKSVNFSISATSLTANHSLNIDSIGYKDTELVAILKNTQNSSELSQGFSYKWYRNGTEISGAATDRYMLTADDIGAKITCTAIGDGSNLLGSVTSNECTVLSGTRPTGYTRTIAEWNYDYTANSLALANADTSGTGFYYNATGGELQSEANLYACVNGVDPAKIKWSDDTDLYLIDGKTKPEDRAPVMGTSKSSNLAWDYFPYFETVISTLGYDNIRFSAKLGGTNKGPKIWQLYYSLDGVDYIEVEGALYSIINNKTMETAFDNVQLPAECANQKKVYIRMEVYDDVAINGTTIMYQLSGDAAVNDIAVTGNSFAAVTSLKAPTITSDANDVLFSDNKIEIKDNNGGADIYYTINNGSPILYSGAFNPFDTKTAKGGDTALITAYSQYEDIRSDSAEITAVFGGTNINNFSYEDFSKDVTAGAVQSTGGIYGESGRMTAMTDGTTQYVPLWRADNGSFCVSPDDNTYWTENSGFTYQVATAGFENITFTCDAYTTAQGPKSVTLQYSLDGKSFTDVQTNIALSANAMLERLVLTAPLPSECSNKNKIFIRLATKENSTYGDAINGSTTLHNNQSKGNLYVNNVIVAGDDNGTYKMPYTNKSTNYFGTNGFIEYISPDGIPMKYIVTDASGNRVLEGDYTAPGIKLSSAKGFDPTKQEPYRIVIEAVEDEDRSTANGDVYYYKGETVVKFNYNSSTKLFADYVASDYLSVSNSSGANSGTLSMCPNANDKTPLTYTGTYGVRVSWTDTNKFTATKNLDNPDGNGYWLIETSTKGFKNLTLNLDQLSSNNGPRDWGVAYSTDNNRYTYVASSNVRAISNDSANDTVETYGNLPLPAECDNQDKLFIKIFINGGESVDGDELIDVLKGNTGINNIELSGIPLSRQITVSAVLPQALNGTVNSTAISGAQISVNGLYRTNTDSSGTAVINIPQSIDAVITIKFENTEKSVTISAADSADKQEIALPIFDYNNDGYVNAKDFAKINSNTAYSDYKQYFSNYIGTVSQ